jgi:hypothetical protein
VRRFLRRVSTLSHHRAQKSPCLSGNDLTTNERE